jgi:AcrR family transcriptional regulator
MTGVRARRREILDTALETLGEEGLAGLTMPGLAKRIECAVGGLYRYFPSKEALLVALQREALDGFARELEEQLSTPPPTQSSQASALYPVVAAAWAYLQDAVRAPTRHRLLDALVSDPDPVLDPDGVVVAEEPLERILGRVARQVAAASDAGALAWGDPAQRTHVLWATVHGLDHLRKRDHRAPAGLRTGALARVALEALLIGWGADSEALAQVFAVLGPLA